MPLVEAFPLGLVLASTTTTILADGSQSPKLVALGHVVIGEEEQTGAILLNMGSGPSDVLVGMEFLESFQKSLLICRPMVALIDNEDIQEIIGRWQESRPPGAEGS